MASTYTTNTGIELITNGEQSDTGGDTTNTNLQIIDRLTNGVGSITLSGTTHTLTTSDGALSDGQYSVLVFGGSPTGTNTVTISPNDQQKVYFVKNSSGESVILTQGSGGNVTVADGEAAIVYADGGGSGAAVVDISFLALDANGDLSLGAQVQAASYVETVATATGTTPSLDLSTANSFTITTSGNTTFTFDYSSINLTTDDSYGFILKITAGGTHTLTWPASVDWPGGVTPTAPASGNTDVFVFYTLDGGTNWYGFQAGDAMG